MALSRKILATISSSMLLIGCGTPQLISTPIENIDSVPLKNSELTKDQLKNWGSYENRNCWGYR